MKNKFHIILVLIGMMLALCINLKGQEIQCDTLTIHFAFNRHVISENSSQKIVHFFSGRSSVIDTITIMAHTDSVGSGSYNKNLSSKRSLAVYEIVKDITNSNFLKKIQIINYGEEKVSDLPDSLERRADIIVCFKMVAGNKQNDLIQNSQLENILDSNNTDDTIKYPKQNRSDIVDTVISLDKIYFIEDTPIMTAETRGAFPSYLNHLKKFRTKRMEIRGHINYQNYQNEQIQPGDPLFKLSEDRAKLVYELLIENGFDPGNLSFRGFGNSQLVYSRPKSLAQKRKNMRVEVVIFK